MRRLFVVLAFVAIPALATAQGAKTSTLVAPPVSASTSVAAPPAPPAAPSVDPPDVVRLKDGGLLRGTIIEKAPGKSVEIRLANGETRTVRWSDVEAAGTSEEVAEALSDTKNARKETPRPPPPPPPRSAPMRAFENLHLTSDDSLTVHVKTGESSWDGTVFMPNGIGGVSGTAEHWTRLCTAPCSTSLAPGEYKFGVSEHGEDVIVAGSHHVRGETTLQVQRNDRAWMRALGWVLIPTSVVFAAVLVNAGTHHDCIGSSCSATTTTFDGTADAGIGVLALGLTAGIILVTRKDTAEVTTVERPAFGLGVGPRGVAAHGAF